MCFTVCITVMFTIFFFTKLTPFQDLVGMGFLLLINIDKLTLITLFRPYIYLLIKTEVKMVFLMYK